MLNMDFRQAVIIDTDTEAWVPSPAPGVWRKPLAREERERGHATSMVRFDPGARFAQHGHPQGEEILVLEGTFSDEYGDYPAGAYIRNPAGFKHTSFSDQGCTLFVKLHQFQPDDRQQIHIDTHNTPWMPGLGQLRIMPLHEFKAEHTALVHWPAGYEPASGKGWGGEEIVVLSGELRSQDKRYGAGCWLRGPSLSKDLRKVEEDTVIWLKTGHLAPL
jgi:anti-sigma factor ChrR (cupin superfamily)